MGTNQEKLLYINAMLGHYDALTKLGETHYDGKLISLQVNRLEKKQQELKGK